MSRRSHRGDMLLQWCTQHAYSLANTFDDADPDHAWTYRHGDIRKMLDYFLLDSAMIATIVRCSVFTPIDIGSDHRPQMLELAIRGRRGSRGAKKNKCSTGWKADDAYKNKLTEFLTAPFDRNASVTDKAAYIQKTMLKAVQETCLLLSRTSR